MFVEKKNILNRIFAFRFLIQFALALLFAACIVNNHYWIFICLYAKLSFCTAGQSNYTKLLIIFHVSTFSIQLLVTPLAINPRCLKIARNISHMLAYDQTISANKFPFTQASSYVYAQVSIQITRYKVIISLTTLSISYLKRFTTCCVTLFFFL